MTVLAEHHVHFVVDPAEDETANIMLESSGRPVCGYVVSWTGFLYAGDKGQLAAMRFLAEKAPQRVRSLVARTLESDFAFYLNRTLVTREEMLDAFGVGAASRLAA